MSGILATPDTQLGRNGERRRSFFEILTGARKKETPSNTVTNNGGNKRVDADPDPENVARVSIGIRARRRNTPTTPPRRF